MSSITLVWKPVPYGGGVEYHAFLLYDDGTSRYYARGGPSSGSSAGTASSGSGRGSVPGLGPITTEHGPYVDETPDYPEAASWPRQNIISGEGLDLSDLWRGITRSLDRMNAARFWYGPYPFGSGTSNSVIFSALKDNGFDDIEPVVCGPLLGAYACAPGWNTYLHPSGVALGNSGTLRVDNATVPPLPYLPSGPFGGGLSTSNGLGLPQPNPPYNSGNDDGAVAGGLLERWPAGPVAPGSFPTPVASRAATSVPNPTEKSGIISRSARAPVPQPFPAAPPPWSVPVPEALRPLVQHFYPEGFVPNQAQATPAEMAPPPFAAPPSYDVPIPEALRPLLRLFDS